MSDVSDGYRGFTAGVLIGFVWTQRKCQRSHFGIINPAEDRNFHIFPSFFGLRSEVVGDSGDVVSWAHEIQRFRQ